MKKPAAKRRGSGTAKRSQTKGVTDAEILADIRQRMRDEIERKGMSLRGLSHAAGLGSNTVRHTLEISGDMSVQTLISIARALGVMPAWFITGTQAIAGATSSDPLNLRLLPIFGSHEAEEEKPEIRLGNLCIEGAKFPADARAMLIEDSAMLPVGMNQPVPQQNVLIRGDVVVWSKSAPWQPGSNVVARIKIGQYGVRRIQDLGDGEYQLLANDESYARLKCKASSVLGPVLAVWRRTEQR